MTMRFLRVLAVALAAASSLGAQERPWSIDPKPALVLGDINGDVMFGGGLVGATRLHDGRILVGDRGDFSLKAFDATGKLVKSLGRKGTGPGEIEYLARLWRCGGQIATYDIGNGGLVTIFAADLTLLRSFRFKAPPTTSSPYMSACNAAGTFAHLGWESMKGVKGGVFRTNTPMWFSETDTVVRAFAEMPGSERWGLVVDGALRGTRPLPLGKQPVIALGPDRLYAGSADTYTITMYDLNGKVIGSFSKPNLQLATTKADIDLAVEDQAAGRDEGARERVRKEYAAMDLPQTIPAYKAMLVDSEGMVWIRDYRRASPTLAQWTVFTRDGKQVAEVLLPLHLTVSEIGRDYVLGKYVDPVEDIPEIRMYRLRR